MAKARRAGAPRKAKADKKQAVTVAVYSQQRKLLIAVARKDDITVSHLVRRIITAWAKNRRIKNGK